MPAVISNKSQGIVGVPAPFHFPLIWDTSTFFTDTGAVANIQMPLPACLPGDLLIMFGVTDGGSNSPTFPSVSPDADGWVFESAPSATSPNTLATIWIASKIAEAGDSVGTVQIDMSPNAETNAQCLAIIGSKGRAGLQFGTRVGAVSATISWSTNPVTVDKAEHYLSIAWEMQDDNRNPAPANPSGWASIHSILTTGSGGAGLSSHTFQRSAVAQNGEQVGPTDDLTISSSEHMETAVVAVEPTAGELYASQTAMNILNPTFASDFSNWTTTIGGFTRSGGGGSDGTGFAFGNTGALSLAYQDIAVPAALETVADQGRLRAQVDYFGNSAGNDDERVNLYWLDAVGSPEADHILDPGVHTNEYMGSHGGWVARQAIHCAPANARFLRIEMDARREQSSQNDGYLDQFSGLWLEMP